MVNNLIKINLKSNSAVKQLQMMNNFKILLIVMSPVNYNSIDQLLSWNNQLIIYYKSISLF